MTGALPDPFASAELTAETLSHLASMSTSAASALKTENYAFAAAGNKCKFITHDSNLITKISGQPAFLNWPATSKPNVFESEKTVSFNECKCLVGTLSNSARVLLNAISSPE
jgi:hypothetical protein